MPAGTPTVRILHRNGVRHYVVGGHRETTLALANLGCVSVHLVSGRAGAVDRPDWVCFDLDPASKRFADAARAGLRLKEALDALALRSFAKTSGKSGLHVFVPIRVGPDVGQVRDFAERLGALLARAHPEAEEERAVQGPARASDTRHERHPDRLEQLGRFGAGFAVELGDDGVHAPHHVRTVVGVADDRVELGELVLVLRDALLEEAEPVDELTGRDVGHGRLHVVIKHPSAAPES